ncbi:hypothetical protein PMAYCL1PPCAC_27101, partial [Pristionchus mayeri]
MHHSFPAGTVDFATGDFAASFFEGGPGGVGPRPFHLGSKHFCIWSSCTAGDADPPGISTILPAVKVIQTIRKRRT